MANFTPTWTEWTDPGPFRFWAQKVLPLIYDDSLSYYEVLCKVVAYLNTTIQTVSALGGNVEGLRGAYEQLQQYVNDYFTNLDVQQEINTKLDNMAETGALTTLIKPFVNAQISSDVAAWLDFNIKPTTPAIDASLTVQGAAADAKATGLLVRPTPQSANADLNTMTTPGVYDLVYNIAYTNAPIRYGRRQLHVFKRNHNTIDYYVQLLLHYDADSTMLYYRWGDGSTWQEWQHDTKFDFLQASKLNAPHSETEIPLTFVTNSIIARGGGILDGQSDATLRVSDPAAVTPGQILRVRASTKYYNGFFIFTKTNGDLVEVEASDKGGGTADVLDRFVVVPAGAAYIRIADCDGHGGAWTVTFRQVDIDSKQDKPRGYVPETITWIPGKIINASGNVANVANSDTAYRVSDYIPVAAGSTFRIRSASNYAHPFYSFFNSAYANVGIGPVATSSGATQYLESTGTVPAGAVYMVTSWVQKQETDPDDGYLSVYKTADISMDNYINMIDLDGSAPEYSVWIPKNHGTWGRKWDGLKWVVIGDSLTDANNARATKRYFDYVAEATGITVINLGASGTGYRNKGSGNNNAFWQRVNNIPTDADVITIFGSFNDGVGNIGETADDNQTTLCGCFNTTIAGIFNHMTLANLGIVSPTPWETHNNFDSTLSTTGEPYAQALEKVCYRWSVPFLNLYHDSLLRPWDATFRAAAYSHDDGGGTHPDENGHKLIAPRFEAFLDRLLIHR